MYSATELEASAVGENAPCAGFPILRFCLGFGGVRISIENSELITMQLPKAVQPFQVDDGPCDISLSVHCISGLADFLPGTLVFDSGCIWRLFHNEIGYRYDFSTPALGSEPYKRVLIDQNFTSGEILINRNYLDPQAPQYPLEYPLDELLVVNKVADGTGVEVHGCGIVDEGGEGMLFAGHSGAGKSTTARLWSALRNVRILSDDRILLRQEGGRIWMHGTPWHGEAGFAEAASAPLRDIFVLEHGSRNWLRPLPPVRATAELFARCFLPFHSTRAMEGTMAFLASVTEMVQCRQFQFVPDVTCVQSIAALHQRGAA